MEAKGSKHAIRACKFVFTSNFDPANWYPGPRPELERRLRESATIIQLGPLDADRKVTVISRIDPEGHGGPPDVSALGSIFAERAEGRE